MGAAAELAKKNVSKHQIQPEYGLERATAGRDSTAEPVSRDLILRRERRHGNIVFPCSAEKEWMGCFLNDLRAFGINADQWTTAAQDEGEWRRTAEQGAEYFISKWIAAEEARAGLRHEVVCPNVTGRTTERIAQSKRALVD